MSDEHDSGRADDVVADGGGPSADGIATLTLDTVFSLLSNRRRRYVVYHLIDAAAERVEYTDIAAQVAAWEDGGEPTDERVAAVAADLYHSHLPKLDAENVVDFDPRSGVVRYWGQPTVEEYAEHAAYQELPDR